MQRRNFLLSSMAGAAAAALTPTTLLASCAPKKDEKKATTPLNLCFQEGIAIGDSLQEKLDYCESLGVTGFEVGGRGLAGRVDEINNALKGRNVRMAAICAGFDGFILAEDGQKDAFDRTMREIIEAAGKINSCGVIMVPAFNGQQPCRPHTMDTRNYLCEQLHELGEFAVQCGTTVILEPLNRGECFYMRLVADGAAIARDAQSEGVKCMGDFWHMKEETSDYGAFWSAGTKYLQHVHIASRGRRLMPGEDGEKDDYRDGFRALKEMGYDKFITLECGTQGERKDTVTAAVELIRAQWAEV